MRIEELRFLVVEDHAFQRMALTNLLTGLGASQVLEAPHGRAALTLFEDMGRFVDIVVSDLDMPDMDGMEFIRHLGLAHMPVSVILTSALGSQVIEATQAMSESYGVKLLGAIEKPVTAAALKALIDKHRVGDESATKPFLPGATVEEIAEGLQRREFEAFFQPKVELRTGRLRGAEALARWRRSGIVLSPASFLQELDDGGYIDELTWLIFGCAAENCRRWHDAGIAIPVSVNISLRSVSDVSVGERITTAAAAYGLKPSQVILEVTESAIATNLGAALETLTRLRVKGFGLSIDDFGTGYSSLQQVTRIPCTELKIDQSFVTEAASHPSRRVILKSSLELARQLGIVSVGEGVESQADWDLLRELGCDLAQGHFIGEPMQAEHFLEWAAMRKVAA